MKRVWGRNLKTAVLLAACLTGSAARADTVELANGDTLTGQIVEQSDKGVVLKHPALGTLAIAAERIKHVAIGDQAPDPPSTEKTKPKTKPEAAKPDPNTAKVKQDAEQAAADEPVSALDWLLTDWNNKLTLGLNGAGGNTDRQNYYLKLASSHTDGRDRWVANASWFYGVANGNTSQNQVGADLTKDWLQEDSPWFFFIKGQYKYDEKRAWENRTSAFGGGGYTLAKTDHVEVNTRLGFGGTYEFGNVNDFTPEALFGGSVIQWKLSDRTAISGETIYYPSLEDASQFRIESKLEWVYKLDMAKGLSLKFGVENEYDSTTPNDAGNNDLKYYGAMVLSF